MVTATKRAEPDAAKDIREFYVILNVGRGWIEREITILDDLTTAKDVVRLIEEGPEPQDEILDVKVRSGVICREIGGRNVILARWETCASDDTLIDDYEFQYSDDRLPLL